MATEFTVIIDEASNSKVYTYDFTQFTIGKSDDNPVCVIINEPSMFIPENYKIYELDEDGFACYDPKIEPSYDFVEIYNRAMAVYG
tara:strand:- start:599 stop:856 length:258 start_codon:yes stop_codon:yes gene_type:complete